MGIVFLAYAAILLVTGCPTVVPLRRPSTGKTPWTYSVWLRLAGGLYIASKLLPDLGVFDYVLLAACIISFFIGLWQALSLRVL